MSAEQAGEEEACYRASCFVHPTYHRFITPKNENLDQFARLYRHRIQSLMAPSIGHLKSILRGTTKQWLSCAARACKKIDHIDEENPPSCSPMSDVASLQTVKIAELTAGTRQIITGVLYKETRGVSYFLKLYQAELERIDLGGDDDDENEAEGESLANPIISSEVEEETKKEEELFLEDDTGRVQLRSLSPSYFCTGLVLAACGCMDKQGDFYVEQYAFRGIESLYQPPSFGLGPAASPRTSPCYIAFVCGLSLGGDENLGSTERMVLREFLWGNGGGPALQEKAACIARLVIGGNSIVLTDEVRLKEKVRLEFSDHPILEYRRLVNGAPRVPRVEKTAAPWDIMSQQLDPYVADLLQTVNVDLMPGESDLSNASLPQQPLSAILLPRSSRLSTLQRVTNPYEFKAFPDVVSDENAKEAPQTLEAEAESKEGVRVFVTAGQNVEDLARQTEFQSGVERLQFVLECGHACPTAPSSLWSYPFEDRDPYVFTRCPHIAVACNQPEFETAWKSFSSSQDNEEEPRGVRLVCVPSFSKTGTLVLVDLNSPTFEAIPIPFHFNKSP